MTQKSRRDFIRASSLLVAGGAVTGSLGIARSVHAQGNDLIKIGLIGCGSRGKDAAVQALSTTSGPVKLVAMADVFGDKIQAALRQFNSRHARQLDVPQDRHFVGLEGYKSVLASDVNLVILATPPGFRPLHFEAAVAAGKHVFMEKPVAVDAPGVQRVLLANTMAKQKGLAVTVGLQSRHEQAYQQTIAQLQQGLIGDVVTLRVYWNGGGVWTRPRRPEQTELEYQLRNWYYFGWLSGDHIVEQHIQGLDVGNWLMSAYPSQTNAQGGREVRRRCHDAGKDFGQIFDHFFCEYIYPNGVRMFSQCRHIRNCWNCVSQHVHGTKGYADISGGKIYSPAGQRIWSTKAPRGGHQQEQHDLFAALRAGQRPNEADYGAKSTMTAILGRMAAYSGQAICWDDALTSKRSLANTDALASLTDIAPVMPDALGDYPVPVPGVTEPV